MTCCLNKNIYSRSKNWLSLINSVEMRHKKTVSPYYGNLYHYAGNNPIKYTDPDGKFTFDSHNPYRIIANLDDPNDLRAAAELLSDPNLGYTLTAYGETSGITKNFKNYAEVCQYLNPNKGSYSFDYSVDPKQNIKEHNSRRHEYKDISVMRFQGHSDKDGFSNSATFLSVDGDFDTMFFVGGYADVLEGSTTFDKRGHIQAHATWADVGVRAGVRLFGYKFSVSGGGDLGAGFEVSWTPEAKIFDVGCLLKVRLELVKENYDDYTEK